MKKSQLNEYNKVFPSGVCQMGSTSVTYYRISKKIWFDKKAIEFVLTGKNQHNLLGQYKDPRNHNRIFDTNRKEVIDVISKTGVHNYLKKAWSVAEENRYAFYAGMKTIEKPHEKTVTEPIQMPIFEEKEATNVNPVVKITEIDGTYSIDYSVSGKNVDEKKQNLAKMLIAAANNVLTGMSVSLKEVA